MVRVRKRAISSVSSVFLMFFVLFVFKGLGTI